MTADSTATDRIGDRTEAVIGGLTEETEAIEAIEAITKEARMTGAEGIAGRVYGNVKKAQPLARAALFDSDNLYLHLHKIYSSTTGSSITFRVAP